MNIVAIIQARAGGTRLPGKVLREFGRGSVISHIVRRVRSAVPRVVLALPDTAANDNLASLASWFSVDLYRGPEDDVLARFWGAAVQNRANIIVRITADCPLVDPALILDTIAPVVAGISGYAATGYDDTGKRRKDMPRGLDVEAFTMKALALAHWGAWGGDYREHVTGAIRAQGSVAVGEWAGPHHMRWTLDTPEDAAWFDRLAQHVDTEPPHPTTQEVLDYIAKTGDVLYETPPTPA